MQCFKEINTGSSIQKVCNIFLKTSISYPLMSTPTCTYQAVKNVSFSEDFSYELNDRYP